ncbi:MAG: FUSC family protein [Eubacterium sp.]
MEKKRTIPWKTVFSNFKTFLFTIIFINVFNLFFGSSNLLIGVGIITALMMFTSIELGIRYQSSPFLIISLFVGVGLMSQLSLINPWLGFVINVISVFCIMFFTSESAVSKTYMAFLLCYIFAQSNPVSGHDYLLRLVSFAIFGILLSLIYGFCQRKNKSAALPSLRDLIQKIDYQSETFIFAIKMALGLGIAMLFGQLLGLQKSLWVSMTVMSLTQLNLKETHSRIKYRVFGTLIGIVAYIILFNFLVPVEYTTIVVLIMSYIYTFIKDYKIQIIFITINALTAAKVLFGLNISAPMRIGLILCGVAITLIISHIPFKRIFNNLSHKLNRKKEATATAEN